MKSLNSVRINMERLTEIYQDGQLESRYHYDANGNIVQRNTASGKWLYEYDAENRLTETIKNGQIESSYLYGDQLGSVSAVADTNGNLVSTILYELRLYRTDTGRRYLFL